MYTLCTYFNIGFDKHTFVAPALLTCHYEAMEITDA